MGVTFFDLKPKKNNIKTKSQESEKVKKKIILSKHTLAGAEASFIYVDVDGVKKRVTENLQKLEDGSYIMSSTKVVRHPIYDKENIEYKEVDEHFSYKDKDGNKKVFNKTESLRYDESSNTYYGLVEDIEYITSTVEVFTKDENL